MTHERRSLFPSYAFAVACWAAALLLRTIIDPLIGDSVPFITFFAAVLGAAWFGGLRPALLAVLLSAVSSNWFFIAPRRSLALAGWAEAMALVTFVAMGILIALLGEAMRRATLRAEALARDSRIRQAELQVTLRSIGDAVIACDAAGRVVFMNPVAERVTAWTEAEARGRPLDEVFVIVNEHSRLPVENPARRALQEGRVVGMANHTVLLARDGAEHPIDDSAAPIRGETGDGAVEGVVLVFRDIGERRRIERSRSELAAIVESSGDAIIGKTLDGVITSWNRGAERLYGYSAEEVVGKTISILAPEGEPDPYQAAVSGFGQGETTSSYEAGRIRKDGTRVDVSVMVSPIRDGSGRITGASTIARDITERLRTERALSEGRERLRLALAGGSMGIWTRELDDSNRVEWSPELEAIFGFPPGGFSGREEDFFELVHPEDRPALVDAVGGALRNRTDYEVEFRFFPRGGGLRWMIGRGRATYDADGRPLRLAGVGVDITARKQAEESLRFLADASTSLADLVDHESTLRDVARRAVPSFCDLCVVDLVSDGGRIERVAAVHADPEKERLLERMSSEYPPRWGDSAVIVRVLREGRPEIIPEVSASLLAGVAQDEGHLAMIRALNPLSVVCVPMLGRERVLGALWFASSESRRTYQPRDLAVAEDLAQRVAIALENVRLYREAREADQRKDEFLAMLAHELRNPLAPISNALQVVALRGHDPAVVAQAHAMLERQVDQLIRLVDDLLDVSRITRGKIRLQKEKVDLATLVSRAVESCGPLIESRGHRVEVELPAEPMLLDADPARLEQVLTNLLNNAAKYTEGRGRIDVGARLEAGRVVLRVRDTGMGIAPEMLPRVFDLFAQGSRSLDRSQGGLGIGLTLVKRLVELHGGEVQARSEGLGLGSEFVVSLPLHPESAASGAGAAGQGARPKPAASTRRILVVDDNVDSAESLSMLVAMWGHDAQLAHDGPRALEVAGRFQPEVVFLDIGLPGMSGYEVARRLRSISGLESTLLVAMTGYGQEEDRRRSREAGFDHHFIKPVDPEALRGLLASLGGASGGAGSG